MLIKFQSSLGLVMWVSRNMLPVNLPTHFDASSWVGLLRTANALPRCCKLRRKLPPELLPSRLAINLEGMHIVSGSRTGLYTSVSCHVFALCCCLPSRHTRQAAGLD